MPEGRNLRGWADAQSFRIKQGSRVSGIGFRVVKRKDSESRKKQAVVPKLAAAIRYDSAKDDAPRLTAKGKGHMAEKIIELARKHNIPIRTDQALVHILSKLDLDQQIPPDLYRAVAEILAFVYSANETYRDRQGSG